MQKQFKLNALVAAAAIAVETLTTTNNWLKQNSNKLASGSRTREPSRVLQLTCSLIMAYWEATVGLFTGFYMHIESELILDIPPDYRGTCLHYRLFRLLRRLDRDALRLAGVGQGPPQTTGFHVGPRGQRALGRLLAEEHGLKGNRLVMCRSLKILS